MASQSQGNVAGGAQQASTPQGEYNKIIFAVNQALAKMKTSTLVRVDKCTNAGGVSPVGYVDVTPLVNQVDGNGNGTPHVTIYGIPYLRIQGGANAVIIDPQAGDIGICSFASRDISKVKSTKSQSNPGSGRQFSFSDGMYMGGMLNGTPTQYIQFDATGIKILSPNKVTIQAPDVEVVSTGICGVTATGTLSVHSDSVVNVTAPTINLN